MNTTETVMQPFVWNYTHIRGTSFSRNLIFSAPLPGAVYNLVLTGSGAKVKMPVKVLGMSDKETAINISLSAQDTLDMQPQNKWALIVTFRSETFICWTGHFNLKAYI